MVLYMAELAAAVVVQAGTSGEGGGADSFSGKIPSVMGDVTETTKTTQSQKGRPEKVLLHPDHSCRDNSEGRDGEG